MLSEQGAAAEHSQGMEPVAWSEAELWEQGRTNGSDWHGEEQGAETGHAATAAQPKLALATQQDLMISNHECNSLQRGKVTNWLSSCSVEENTGKVL